MSLTDTNLREKNFHNKLHSGSGKRSENIFYKAIFNLYKDFYDYLDKYSANKIVLDFGCGSGGITEKIAKQNPSKIVGIDISEISIKKAKENAKVLNLDIEYKVENCEKSSLDNNFFDLIYGTGILHHLNLKSSAKEINRLLKKDGQMVMRFFLPKQYSLKTAPKPTDKRVTIAELPEQYFGVIRFSGFASDSNFDNHRQELKAALDKDGLVTAGQPIKATYNSPFTVPFLRRNEVMYPLVWQ